MAGHLVGEVREQATHRPAVHEQHVGTVTDASVRNLTCPDIEIPLWFVPKEIRCGGGREGGHRRRS